MIAFDLDGVFLSDIVFETDAELEHLLKIRTNHLSPIFLPSFPYYLITGRPIQDEEDTKHWIAQTFPVTCRPQRIFHDNPDFRNPVAYKARVLTENPEIAVFVESDVRQVEELRRATTCRIEHFAGLVSTLLSGLCDEG